MRTIRELYKIGNGPSSSHTMGPKKAAEMFRDANPNADRFEIVLYGSLASTGRGHLTDYIIRETLKNKLVDIFFDEKTRCERHPNTMELMAYKDDELINVWKVYSVGGGVIEIEGEKINEFIPIIYEHSKFSDIREYCEKENVSLSEYVFKRENEEFKNYLWEIWNTMKNSVEEGLQKEGVLPGALKITRKAKRVYENIPKYETAELKKTRLLLAYAYSVSEMNSSGGVIVTAPTCGAAGVLPAVLYYAYKELNMLEEKIIEALAVAGLMGNLIKTNASISGAECGCQAEVGTACSMAAAAFAYLNGYSIMHIEKAAEIAMEHHLGLTCDPVQGYVQIPCIERNGVAAMRAIDSAYTAHILDDDGEISFDTVVDTMYETGKDLKSHYRETSKGGLAKKYCRNKFYNPDME